MIRNTMIAALLTLVLAPAAPAAGQPPQQAPTITGTRLDISATGEVTRVPDVVRLTAAVVTEAPGAAAALRLNAQRMDGVRAALAAAGIADRDVQTRNFSLQARYRNLAGGGRGPLIGYSVSNQLLIRFRDVSTSGAVLDALVAQGVNQIDGPILAFDRVEALYDEARTAAIASARARAELYARGFGLRVKRVVSVDESTRGQVPEMSGVINMAGFNRPSTVIDPGGHTIAVSINVVFELE